jgi:hypothetical protein
MVAFSILGASIKDGRAIGRTRLGVSNAKRTGVDLLNGA